MLRHTFLEDYIDYTEQTECPRFFHRWAAISALGAWLAKDIHFNFGHFKLYPNLYILMIGSPGTKKSTAIKIAVNLLEDAGYKHFAATKTRQEKYLLDLSEAHLAGDPQAAVDSILDENLWGEDHDSSIVSESFIAADEFGNFIGAGNIDFMSILGDLWDRDKPYKYRLKNSDSVVINNPVVNILGGITATEFNRVFPQEAIGQGFFSRLLIIHDEPSGVKHTIPPTPNKKLKEQLLAFLVSAKEQLWGEVTISKDAFKLLDEIYNTWEPIKDARFEHYANRRLTHLIKLCLVVTASRLSQQIEVDDLVYANTVLSMAEHLMPKALGEFGKGRNSDVTHKVVSYLDTVHIPATFKEIWKHVHTDLDRRDQLLDILQNLVVAEKVQIIDGGRYLPIKKRLKESCSQALDWSVLSDDERKLLII